MSLIIANDENNGNQLHVYQIGNQSPNCFHDHTKVNYPHADPRNLHVDKQYMSILYTAHYFI